MAFGKDAFRRGDALLYLVGAAAVTTLVSIRVFEILMALAVVTLIVTRRRWRLPPVWLPLSLFLLGTLVSLFASGHIRDGLPQVRKFYVYLMLFLVTSAVRTVREIRWVALGWALAATLSSAWALKQFFEKYRAAELAHQNFYTSYVDARITGFMGHWMTLSGELMMTLLVIAALVFFAQRSERDRVAGRSRGAGERGSGAHLDAQHVAGDALRRRVLDLVLEEVGAGGGAGVDRGAFDRESF